MAEKDKEATINLSKSDLQDIVTGAATAAAKAAQQPTVEEQRDRDTETARKNQRRKLMLRVQAKEEQEKKRKQDACLHQKPDGERTIGGQAFSDGMNRYICMRCQKVLVEEPTPELEIAKTELRRLIDAGKVHVRKDGTIEVYENRTIPRKAERGREEQELEA